MIGVVSRNRHHFVVYCMEKGMTRGEDGKIRNRDGVEAIYIHSIEQVLEREFTQVINNIYNSRETSGERIEEMRVAYKEACNRIRTKNNNKI